MGIAVNNIDHRQCYVDYMAEDNNEPGHHWPCKRMAKDNTGHSMTQRHEPHTISISYTLLVAGHMEIYSIFLAVDHTHAISPAAWYDATYLIAEISICNRKQSKFSSINFDKDDREDNTITINDPARLHFTFIILVKEGLSLQSSSCLSFDYSAVD